MPTRLWLQCWSCWQSWAGFALSVVGAEALAAMGVEGLAVLVATLSRLIRFVAQNIIQFEHTIQISLWVHMIRYDGKIRNVTAQNFDISRVFTTLTWCIHC